MSKYKPNNNPLFSSQKEINSLITLFHSGQFIKVDQLCSEFLKKEPHSLKILNIYGASLMTQGKYKMALVIFNKLIQLNPNYASAYANRALVLYHLGLYKESLINCNKAIQLNPTSAEAYCNRGVVFNDLGQFNNSIDDYNTAIQLKPDYAEAYYNLAETLKNFKQLNNALDNYNKAIQISPDYADAYCNRGVLLYELGQAQESLKNYNKAILLDPDCVEAYNNRGDFFFNNGQLEDAENNFSTAILLNPEYADAYRNQFNILNYKSNATQELIYNKISEFANIFINNSFDSKSLNLNKSKINRVKNNDKRLKVGYISPDFKTHSVAYFFLPLLKAHNTNLIKVHCYYNNSKIDETTKLIKKESESWRDIANLDDITVVNLIKKDNIDILVDLAGHTANNRLTVFPYRPAPIQITWLGYPNTTGLDVMDYRFTDNIADPIGEADKFYSEKLIRLPNGFLCYFGDISITYQKKPPYLKEGHITFGSFNDLPKVSASVIKLWSQVLLSVSDSQLIIKTKQFSDSKTKARYLTLFKIEGIDSSRIKLFSKIAKKKDHLSLYNSIDLCLDTFPYNGTTTTCEALWMGVPTITLNGDRHASRVGASIMTHVGLEEFIAIDKQNFINIAVYFSKNINSLGEIRKNLRNKMKNSALCDNKLFAKNIENIYLDLKKNKFCSNSNK